MKKCFLLVAFLATSFIAFSQDIIIKKDGSELQVKVTEIEVPDQTVIAIGTLGGISSILFGLDAARTANQAGKYIASPRIVPSFGINRDRFGNQFTSLGIQFAF